MKLKRNLSSMICISGLIILSGCSVVSAFSPTETPTLTQPPTQTSTPTITPTATEIPFYLDARVWDETLQIPILIYHQFVPDYMNTDATKMRLVEFRDQLQTYYDNGFSLIPLSDWIDGSFIVPDGRKPMVLTIDDLWFGNQIYIQDDGTPSEYSGIGVLWKFSQEHLDFGFHAALFGILGDKYYPEKQVGDSFIAADNVDWYSDSWHIKLGNTVAWAMDNGLEVYNHTFNHWYNWPQISNADIEDQLSLNDYWLREFLRQANREDLIQKLENVIALPQGKWPESDSGKNVVMNYKNTEDEPVLAIMEAYNRDAAQFTPSAFSIDFDPFHIARITASRFMTEYIVENAAQVTTMMTCKLGPIDETQVNDLNIIQAAIQTAVSTQACPEGIFNVDGNLFVARSGAVSLHTAAGSDTTQIFTPTINP